MSEDEYPRHYIGDGVYASFDGYQLWLKTGGSEVALEPAVFRSMLLYIESLGKRVAAHMYNVEPKDVE